MAIVVESVTTQATAEGAVTITKPTGLAVDDFLIAVLACDAANSIATPSGWSSTGALTTGSDVGIDPYILYKKADSADVAASNFSFDVSDGSGELGGVLMRVSGIRLDGSEYQGVTEDNNLNSSASPQSHDISITPSQDGALLIAIVTGDGTLTISSPSINGTNPTWTERFEARVGSALDSLIVNTAVQTTAAAISTFSYTVDTNGAGANQDYYLSLAVFRPRVDVNPAPAVIDVVASVEAPTVSAGASVAASVIDVATSVQAPTVTAEAPDWAPQTKNSTTWTRQSKS